MLEPTAPSRHQLTTYKDGGHHPLARHCRYHVHQHVALRAQLVELQGLVMGAQVLQGLLN